jgi:hypothetical protein
VRLHRTMLGAGMSRRATYHGLVWFVVALLSIYFAVSSLVLTTL